MAEAQYLNNGAVVRKSQLNLRSSCMSLLRCKIHPLASPEVDKHPGGDEYGIDAHQALHQHQGHTNTLQYH
jgi:hypothetical protein